MRRRILIGQVQAGILALVVIDVDRHFLGQVEGFAVGGLEVFEVGPENVVGFTGRNALGEFTVMVGVEFPADFAGFVGGTANFNRHAVDGLIVRTPDRAEDDRVGLFFGG